MKQITHQTKPEQDTALAETTRRPLVRAKHVSTALGIQERTALLHAQSGILPCYRIGTSIRFDMDEVWAAVKGGAK